MNNVNVFSVYSGGGGIDLGFKAAGYNILYSTDFNEDACKTLELNEIGKSIECKDIRNVKFNFIKDDLLGKKDLDCYIGG